MPKRLPPRAADRKAGAATYFDVSVFGVAAENIGGRRLQGASSTIDRDFVAFYQFAAAADPACGLAAYLNPPAPGRRYAYWRWAHLDRPTARGGAGPRPRGTRTSATARRSCTPR
jgi:hypothetical protein